MIVSCEASSQFHRTMLPKHNCSHAQDNAQSNSKSSKFAFRHSFVQSTHRIHERVHPAKSKCASRYNGVPSKIKMHVSLQRRAQKSMSPAHDVRGNPRHTKITILPQFRTLSDHHEVTRGLRRPLQNLRFTTVPQFLTSDEHETTKGLREQRGKFAFHHSFGRPTSTK